MVTIKRVDVRSAFRVSAVLTAIVGAVMSSFVLLALAADTTSFIAGIITLVILIGIQSFFAGVVGAITAYLYNRLVVPNGGGLQIELGRPDEDEDYKDAVTVPTAQRDEGLHRARPVEDNELLSRARQMINQRDYTGAYHLLMRIPENETAAAWLAHLDEIDPTLAFSEKQKNDSSDR